MKAKVNKVAIEVMHGDILNLSVAALVTVTDPNLALDPDLAALTGQEVIAQTREIAWADVGTAVITGAGALKNVEKIIHAVGPRWGEDGARAKLGLVTWQCLSLAEEHHLESIVLPAISVGALGYPIENCAKTMLEQIIDFTFENLRSLKTVILCVPDTALDIFEREFQEQIEALREAGEGQVVQV